MPAAPAAAQLPSRSTASVLSLTTTLSAKARAAHDCNALRPHFGRRHARSRALRTARICVRVCWIRTTLSVQRARTPATCVASDLRRM
eukprot:2645112-Prymnesium_polylepis.1